jgi:hypothetical protein
LWSSRFAYFSFVFLALYHFYKSWYYPGVIWTLAEIKGMGSGFYDSDVYYVGRDLIARNRPDWEDVLEI